MKGNRPGVASTDQESQLSQMVGRHELFERERHLEPVPGWHCCTLVCSEWAYQLRLRYQIIQISQPVTGQTNFATVAIWAQAPLYIESSDSFVASAAASIASTGWSEP